MREFSFHQQMEEDEEGGRANISDPCCRSAIVGVKMLQCWLPYSSAATEKHCGQALLFPLWVACLHFFYIGINDMWGHPLH